MFSRLNFRFYWNDQGWRIFDVSANGASAVAYYRSYFGEMFTLFPWHVEDMRLYSVNFLHL